MLLYHKTYPANAIFTKGSKGGVSPYEIDSVFQGVWLLDRPLDDNKAADWNYVPVTDIPEELVTRYEWVEAGRPYREFLVPIKIVNHYGPPKTQKDKVRYLLRLISQLSLKTAKIVQTSLNRRSKLSGSTHSNQPTAAYYRAGS